MTPKEKAEELVNKYLMNTPIVFHIDDAKECALIAVDEIMHSLKFTEVAGNLKYVGYWSDVKQEIIKI